MCLGHTHALSGAAAGAAAGFYLLHLPLPGTMEMAACCAAFATLPDIDKRGSCVSRSLGFLSAGLAWVVNRVSGGHRHATHSIAGAAVFAGLAWLGAHYRHDPAGRWGLALLLALAFAAGLRALRLGGHGADLLAIGAAVAATVTGAGLALVPAACLLGCLVHIAGDMLTDEGCPLLWPLTGRHLFLLPSPLRFETGHAAERFAVTPVLVAALGLLALHAAAIVTA
jgi:membrane-bound metal-dependent hydrolase YbcI (DUF457 family)